MTKLTDEERRAYDRFVIKAWEDDCSFGRDEPTMICLSFDTPCQSPEISRLDSYRPNGT